MTTSEIALLILSISIGCWFALHLVACQRDIRNLHDRQTMLCTIVRKMAEALCLEIVAEDEPSEPSKN